MFKFISLLILTTLTVNGFAQEQIQVHYISQTTFEIDNENKDNNAQFQEVLERAMKEIHEFELTIDGMESTFKSIDKIRNDQADGKIRLSFGIPNSNLYKNVNEKYYIRSTHHNGYLEKDTLDNWDWNITREKDKILNYEVRKAISRDSLQTIVAWYAPSLNFKTGPSDYWGLPGLILKVESQLNGEENEKIYFLANAIEIISNAQPLDIPNKGKLVSAEKINEMNRKNMQYFNDMSSQGVDTSD